MQRFQCNSALYSPPAPVCFLSVPCLPTRRAPHGITRNVCNEARNGGCEEAPTDCFCLLGMTSHRFHRSTQMVWVRKILPQIEQNSQNLLLGMTSHGLHRSTQMVWVRKILPQITQNSQNLLLGMTSHRWHRSTQMVRVRKIVAEVSLPPQQQSDSHRLHRSTQKLLISGWCTSCSVGALETSAPPWRHPNNLCKSVKSVGGYTHPNHLCKSVKSVGEYTQQEVLWILWNLWENIRNKNEICGRIFSAKTSVRSAYSVGDPLLRRRQDTSATMKICGRIYAVRVDSVGGHTITARR